MKRGFVKTEVEIGSANFSRQILKRYFTILTRISKQVPLRYVFTYRNIFLFFFYLTEGLERIISHILTELYK